MKATFCTKPLLYIFSLLLVISCEKPKAVSLDLPEGSAVSIFKLKGFSLTNDIYVTVGNQNVQVANCFKNSSLDLNSLAAAIRVPFEPGVDTIPVQFKSSIGKVFATYKLARNSDKLIRFLATDTNFVVNPTLPQPGANKMGLLLQYASAELPNYEDSVDISFYYISKTSGLPSSTLYTTITNIRKNEFSNLVELPKPDLTRYGNGYAFYVRIAGKTTALPLGNFSSNEYKYIIPFTNRTKLVAISDDIYEGYKVRFLESYLSAD